LSQRFAEIERRRTDEIADVLDGQQIERSQIKLLASTRDHAGFKMAQGSRRDLHNRSSGAG
jgi:hypothetical protein